MFLRDYFAGQALIAMLTNPIYNDHTSAQIAQTAYMQADAMIKERNA